MDGSKQWNDALLRACLGIFSGSPQLGTPQDYYTWRNDYQSSKMEALSKCNEHDTVFRRPNSSELQGEEKPGASIFSAGLIKPATQWRPMVATVPNIISKPPRQQRVGGPSKFRGVVWHKSNSKWEARIYEGGKQRFLGYYMNEEEAATAYDKEAARIHGNPAKLNFPERYPELVLAAESRGMKPSNAAAAVKVAKVIARRRPTSGQPVKMRVQPVKGSSRFRGVSWNSNCQKWRAQVWKGSEVHHLGYFGDEEEAARAYDQAVLRIRGPNAPTNFPRSNYGVHTDDEDNEDAVPIKKPPSPSLSARPSRQSVRKVADSSLHGVSWEAEHQMWVAEIWNGSRYISLGAFDTEVEAGRCYDLACLEQHGLDARTNFPLEEYEPEIAAMALCTMSDDWRGGLEMYNLMQARRFQNVATNLPAVNVTSKKGVDELPQSSPSSSPAVTPVGTAMGASTFNGVSWDKAKLSWFSQIQSAGRQHFLGYFDSEREAALAYDSAALQLHGAACAQLNFPRFSSPVGVLGKNHQALMTPETISSFEDASDSVAYSASLKGSTDVTSPNASQPLAPAGGGDHCGVDRVSNSDAIKALLLQGLQAVLRQKQMTVEQLVQHLQLAAPSMPTTNKDDTSLRLLKRVLDSTLDDDWNSKQAKRACWDTSVERCIV